MGGSSHCTCTICEVDREIRRELACHDDQPLYRQLIANQPFLARHPAPLDLVASAHASKTEENGAAFSDRIFAELLSSPAATEHWEYLQKLLILLFIPTAHAAVRQVAQRYPFLPREDLSQIAFATLLECLRSDAWRQQRSHFGFTVARKLRGDLFHWARAEFECRTQVGAEKLREIFPSTQTAEESFERHAILRHFLHLCEQRAYLTAEEINLLIDLKLEASVVKGQTSNPFRQRVKRLMRKLRQAAQTSEKQPRRKRRSHT